jgi:hypothetical protein
MNNKEILANAPEGNYKSVKMLGDRPSVWVPEVYHSLADIARIVELEKELDQKSLYFVGYTNGNQIAYAKEDEGSFYVNTDNDCYIPVYMLAVHLHRLGGTASEEWMTVLQTKQLGEGVQS